ncbi:MAG: TRAP transporter substrate-binding protein [Rhodocyclaceae bacterium]|nr:TRAP transporter substrate-binding protein [Rhodocyclaceae bacterium]
MKLFRTLALTVGAALLAAGPAQAAPTVVRIASHVSEFSPLHAQSKLFADEIGKRLPGQFEFQLFPSGQLGKEGALLANLQAGSIEMINIASGVLKLDKKIGVFDLPWLFSDRAHVQRAMKAGLEDAIRARIEDVGRVKVIGVYENGFRHVMNGRRAIHKPEDLEGLKIRISGGKFRQAVFKDMGATPQSVPWGETFTALQTGVVDGAEAATYGFYEQKHFEVAGHLSLTSHVYTPSFLMMSQAFHDSLTPEQRAVFVAVGREITDRAYAVAAELEARYFEEMKARTEINPVDLPAFQAATGRTHARYEADFGDEYLTFVRSTAQAR